MEAAAAKVRTSLEGEDTAAIQSATEELMELVQKVGAQAYQQPGPQADGADSASGAPEGGDEGDEVVEGEFKESDGGE